MTTNEIEAVLTRLAAAPRRLAALSRKVDDARLGFRPDAETWSAGDILAHLRAAADVWGKGLQAMIQQDHPTLRYVSPRTWLRKTDYLDLPFSASLAAYTRQRAELLSALKALPIDGWSRGATFTATTRGREQTVLSYAQRIANHESEHLEQIAGLLK
jgi:integrase